LLQTGIGLNLRRGRGERQKAAEENNKNRHCEEERRGNLLLIVLGLKDYRGRKTPSQ